MLLPSRTRRFLQSLCLLGACFLAACEETTEASVNVHGVNYGGDAFSYYVTDPARPKSGGVGGELINAFEAGGTTCCLTLPKKWRPGIKIQVSTTHWLPEKPDGSLPEVKKVQLVDVPKYLDGLPGELWVLRATDGSVDVVSSDFQPDHPSWPGKVKGWPIPSIEYQRERWEIVRRHQEIFVTTYVELLDELEKFPLEGGKKAWESASKYDPAEIKGFSGSNDPRYLAFLKKDYTQGLKESRLELQRVMEARP